MRDDLEITELVKAQNVLLKFFFNMMADMESTYTGKYLRRNTLL